MLLMIIGKQSASIAMHCDKAYTKNSHLNIHIQSVHKGVKFACDQCSKQFSEKCSLRRHILSEHEGIKYLCNQCGYEANQLGNLSKHQKSLQCMKNQKNGSAVNEKSYKLYDIMKI